MMETSTTQHSNAPYTLDSEVASGITDFLANHPPAQLPARGDWRSLRASSDAFYLALNHYVPQHSDVEKNNYTCKAKEGNAISMRWYTRRGVNPGAAIVYVHGGGRIAGSVDLYDRIVANFVHLSGVPFLSVEYRMPPQGMDDSLAEDVFAAVAWLKENAKTLGVSVDRIGVMGDSGGGGIAASVAILARDRHVHLAKQILLYPMLDDRTIEPDPALLPFAVWNYDSNYTGWSATMSQEPGSSVVSPIISPGWGLLFHPDFLHGFPLMKGIKAYAFFSYAVYEALNPSVEEEEETITPLLKSIAKESRQRVDRFTHAVIIAQIELLLSCIRIYFGQFPALGAVSNDLLIKVDDLVTDYFKGLKAVENGLPTVGYFASQLSMSPHYLSDELRRLTGLNGQQHIHLKLLEKAKELLTTTALPVSEVSFRLGFAHVQSFSKFFKSKTNVSPLDFRQDCHRTQTANDDTPNNVAAGMG